MDRNRVIEIIEAYGGYPAAWPEAEREIAATIAESDSVLRTMMDEAKVIDRVLRDWARELVPTTPEAADAAAAKVLNGRDAAPRRWLPRAALGGALAASLAVGALLLARPGTVAPDAPPPGGGLQIAYNGLPGENVEAAQDMLVWGSVFTPTPEEEMVL